MNETHSLLLQFSCTVFMTGLIWFVQVVHYPLMASVGRDQFFIYSQQHQARTTWVVAGPMLAEACLAIWIVVSNPHLIQKPWYFASSLLLVAIWASTAFLQVPLHQKLGFGFDEHRIHKLVRTNWIRTIAWTTRAFLLGWALSESPEPPSLNAALDRPEHVQTGRMAGRQAAASQGETSGRRN